MYDESDFIIFEDLTLQGRLGKIREFIGPKFEKTGEQLHDYLSKQGLHMYQREEL